MTPKPWVSRVGAETLSGNSYPLCPLMGQVSSLSPSAEMPEPGRVTQSKKRALLHLATGLSFTASKPWLDLLARDHLPTSHKAKTRFCVWRFVLLEQNLMDYVVYATEINCQSSGSWKSKIQVLARLLSSDEFSAQRAEGYFFTVITWWRREQAP